MKLLRNRLAQLALGVAAVAASQSAFAQVKTPAFLPAGNVADAPAGFIEMCERDLVLCASGATRIDMAALNLASAQIKRIPGGPVGMPVGLPASLEGLGTAALSRGGNGRQYAAIPQNQAPAAPVTDEKELSKLVRKINREVNSRVIQASDYDSAGVAEKWQRPTMGRFRIGDCEDIAIEKRIQLMEAGFPADRLFYAVVYRSGFGLHTILIARLPDGDQVLDSATSRIVNWTQAPYVWLRQQSATDPLKWTSIGGGAQPAA